MAPSVSKALLAALAGGWLLLHARPARACGPEDVHSVFVNPWHPDRPFAAFAAGRLGVLRDGYSPTYLAYAYRTLSGLPTTPEEQRLLVEAWSRETGYRPMPTEPALKDWLKARASVVPAAPQPEPLLEGTKDDASFIRIQPDALVRAAANARALARLWKKTPALAQEWVRHQDAVFGDCHALSAAPPLDAALEMGLSPADHARRSAEYAYQVAAARFYCADTEHAVADFQAIAASPDSPYRELGTYLAARALVRQVLLEHEASSDFTPEQRARLTRAEALLTPVLADPKQGRARAPVRRLLGLIRIRTDRPARACELFSRVLDKGTGSALEAELVDLNLLYGSADVSCPALTGEAAQLRDWLRTVKPSTPSMPFEELTPEDVQRSVKERAQAYTTALGRWKKTSRLPWLVAALMKANPDSPRLEEVLTAAATVPPDSPGGLTVAWYSANLLRRLGRLDAARERLAAVTPGMLEDQPSAQNLWHQERLATAQGWDEVFREAPRRAVATHHSSNIYLDLADEPRAVLFDSDALSVLGPGLTARRLRELAHSDALPAALQRKTAWTAFARAAVVGDDDTLLTLARELAETEPRAREELLRLAGQPTPEDRRFDARLLLMGLPVVSPFLEPGDDRGWTADPKFNLTEDISFTRNGWCAAPGLKALPSPFAFVPEAEARQALAEWSTLMDAGIAVKWFSRVAMEWAQAHPDDPRSPLALYRVVRASKRGCQGQNTPEARKAFQLLHQRYPKTEWAKKAPYVY